MANFRIRRINEEVLKCISSVLRDVKDPRVSENFISITAVDVTSDMKYAKVYYSVLAPNCEMKEIVRGLKSANGFFRGRLARELNLRVTPELTFIYDASAENAAHMATLMRREEEKAKEKQSTSETDGGKDTSGDDETGSAGE